MPENINDTPARFEENEEYLRDPISNSAKPYSTKQEAANREHAEKVWMYHKTEGARLFDKDDVPEGWQDTPFEHPNNPDHQPEPVENDELKALREEAEDMGIEVDKRWGVKRLKEEMIKHG